MECESLPDPVFIYSAKRGSIASLKSDEHADGLWRILPAQDGLQFPDHLVQVALGHRGLHPVQVVHQDGLLELGVRLVLVLELLRVERADTGPKL